MSSIILFSSSTPTISPGTLFWETNNSTSFWETNDGNLWELST